jgi:Flp pilus assembly pilin Flp
MNGSIVKALGQRKRQALVEFVEEELGQDQIEFALVAALLSLSAIAALKGLAADVTTLWQGLATNLASSI